MAVTRVVNIHLETYDVFIGRGSPFGNPYSHKEGTKAVFVVRDQASAVSAYARWLTTDFEIADWQKPSREQILELHGKRLGCYCVAGEPCHGHVLVMLADEMALGLR